MSRSVDFFEAQFQRQVQAEDYALNPFERLALEHAQGEVLDLGCGLGNLSLELARRGHPVTALDASPTAIERIRACAGAQGLPVRAAVAELAGYRSERRFDTVLAIGLLMFFPRACALALLDAVKAAVAPGGRAIINVLVEGTTYLAMFEPGSYHLFGREALLDALAGWDIRASRHDAFPAPGGTRKLFHTVVAVRPQAA